VCIYIEEGKRRERRMFVKRKKERREKKQTLKSAKTSLYTTAVYILT
jgi:hypothetical protein